MGRRTAVILANTVFEFDNRVRKEAESLTAAGFPVTRVGFVRRPDDRECETTDAGKIVRIRKSHGPAATSSSSSGAATKGSLVRRAKYGIARMGGPLDDLRHYLGRAEENRLLFEVAAPMKPGVVIACDLETLEAGVRLKNETGAFLVYDAHELAVEQYASWSHLRRSMYRRLEKRLIVHADRVITVGPLIARELASRYSVTTPDVVLNGPSEITPEPTPIHEPVRILFQGAFAPNRGLLSLVRAMARMRGRAVLTLQGFGALEEELRRTVENEGLADVVSFAVPCEPRDLIRDGREHDIGVISYPISTKNLLLATPNKLLDYLGAGLAIATIDAPGITDVVDIDECGVAFEAADRDSIAEALERLVYDPVALATKKRNSATIGAAHTWEAEWDRVQRAIDAALAARGAS